MTPRIPGLFAWRYFRSKKTTNAINIIAWISMVAITLVTAALIVVLSVFNGFERMVLNLYGDFYSDLTIQPASGKYLTYAPGLQDSIRRIIPNAALLPTIQERAVLVDDESKSIAWLKGVPESYKQHSGIPRNVFRGTYDIGSAETPSLVLGAGVESALGIVTGMAVFPVTVYFPNRQSSSTDPLEALRSANAFPSGTFGIQQDFDDQYALTHAGFVQYMLGLDSTTFSMVECFDSAGISESRAKQLQALLGPDYEVKTRVRQNQNLYAAMATERLIIYAVALLILLIAAFNIISSLTMMVLEKRTDIALLQAVGATGQTIGRIYMRLGVILAGFGGLAGLLIGTFICWGQQQFHWVKIGGQSFLIDYFPVELKATDFVLILAIIGLVAFIAGFVPARRAAAMGFSLKGND